ncbi:MAG: acyltransferase family protein [Bacilli bacterium]
MSKTRSMFWDNFKGILITLVVLGHFLFAYFLHIDKSFATTITTFIYLFHMPAFIFTTGYLSKSENVFKKKTYIKLLIIYFIFNTFLMIFDKVLNGNSFNLLVPYYSYWYLISVIFWRLIIRPLSKIKGLLPISIAFSLLIGFWSEVGNSLSLVRTIAFFPFFVLGYKYDFKNLKQKILKNSNLRLLIISFVTSLFFTILLLISYKFNFSCRYLLYYRYKDFSEVFIRIFLLVIAFISIFLIYFSLPNKKLTFITKWGKNCLLIYLIHRPITLIFQKFFTYQTYDNRYVFYSLIATFLTMFIFGSDIVNKYFNKFISFLTFKITNSNFFKYLIIFLLIIILLLKPMEMIIKDRISTSVSFKKVLTLLK